MKTIHPFFITSVLAVTILSCKPTTKKESVSTTTTTEEVKKELYTTDNPKGMLSTVSNTLGGLEGLKKLKDVSFEYYYEQPDGKKDISEERYIFEGEVSWAKYSRHQINAAPNLGGNIVQFYNGKEAKVYNNGKAIEDPQLIGMGQFLRQANYMWFSMMYKLTDPGTIHTYLGKEEVEGVSYDKVKVTYDPAITGKAENDIYIVYINPATKIVDRFLFSLPALKVMKPVLLAKLSYQDIDGIKVITKRNMFAPTPEGTYTSLVDQTLKNVKFNNGYTLEGLSKDF